MSELDEARIEVVRRHMALEITHDWDGVIATFDHPRYELLGPGTVFDGEAAVRSYFAASREPFPDQANDVIAIAADAANDTVLVEFWLTGTHLGPLKLGLRTIEPTGKAFRIRMAASFEFAPGSDKIVCEPRVIAAPSRIIDSVAIWALCPVVSNTGGFDAVFRRIGRFAEDYCNMRG